MSRSLQPRLIEPAPAAPTVAAITGITPASGSSGSTVRVYLSRCRSGTTVTIGGSAATVTGGAYAIPGYVDVTVPSGSGAATVAVTDYHGSPSATNGFTYTGGGSPACPNPVQTDLNTQEGTDTNTLIADSFCRGEWYHDVNAAGEATNGGWYRTGDADNPPNSAVNVVSALGSKPSWLVSDYAATSGVMDGSIGGRLMAQHKFVNSRTATECWARYYLYVDSDYVGGHEKMFDLLYPTVYPGNGGEILELLYNRNGSGTIWGIPYLHQDDGRQGQLDAWMGSNLATAVVLTPGHWYFIEKHVKLNTPGSYDGEWDLWMDDLGTDGESIPGTPTHRGQYTDVLYRNGTTEASRVFTGLWIENWANAPSSGRLLYANVKVSAAGPIGLS